MSTPNRLWMNSRPVSILGTRFAKTYGVLLTLVESLIYKSVFARPPHGVARGLVIEDFRDMASVSMTLAQHCEV